jgi:hypothetical protein
MNGPSARPAMKDVKNVSLRPKKYADERIAKYIRCGMAVLVPPLRYTKNVYIAI